MTFDRLAVDIETYDPNLKELGDGSCRDDGYIVCASVAWGASFAQSKVRLLTSAVTAFFISASSCGAVPVFCRISSGTEGICRFPEAGGGDIKTQAAGLPEFFRKGCGILPGALLFSGISGTGAAAVLGTAGVVGKAALGWQRIRRK